MYLDLGTELERRDLRSFAHEQRRDEEYVGGRMLKLDPPGRRKR